jgi:hypothetical protein
MVTRTADCVARGGWSMVSDSCDLWGRQYNYPPLWAWGFHFLDLGESRTEWVGVIMGVLVIGTVVYMAWLVASQSDDWLGLSVVLAASASPPVAMLLERGNTDSIIFLLLVSAGLVASKRRIVHIVLSSVAAGLKVFPAVALWHFYAKRKAWWEPALFIFLALLFLIPTLQYLPLISQRTPYTSEYSYGASVTLSVFRPEVLDAERLFYVPLNLVLTLLGTYLSGTRFDYSLTILLPVLVGTALTNGRNLSLVAFQTLVLISMWGTHFGRDIPNKGNPVSDIAAGLIAALIVALQIADLVDMRRRAMDRTL